MSLDVPTLRRLVRCDFDTGKLYWLPRPVEMFANAGPCANRICRAWNAKHAGKEAFTYSDAHGYLYGRIFRRLYRAHRLVWALAHGEWPREQIDHINGGVGDNRPTNLRDVTGAVNSLNQALRSDNTSGVVGVYWNRNVSKWQAFIKGGGKVRYLGVFRDFEEAKAARKAAEAHFGFHPNHGRAAA